MPVGRKNHLPRPARPPCPPGVPATALHERLFKIDTHIDTPTAGLMKSGWDFAQKHGFAAGGSQCDLPRMAGSVDALVFAVFTMQAARTPAGAGSQASRGSITTSLRMDAAMKHSA